jgi:hypothetical protein
VVRDAEQGVAAHQRKGHGLGGVGGHAGLVERLDRHPGQPLREAREQRRVARPSTAHEHAPELREVGQEVAASPRHGFTSECCERGDQIVGIAATALPVLGERLRLREPIALAARRLRRRAAQELVVQEPLEQLGVDAAPQRAATRPIESLRPPGDPLDHPVEQRVGGPDIEGDHVLRAAAGGEPGHVRDPTEVERDPALGLVTEGGEMEEGSERRALATGGHVARSEVGHRRAARPLRDDGRVADLERGPYLWMVRDRLAVRADRVHLRERNVGAGGHRDRRGRESLAELDVERRKFPERGARLDPTRRQLVDPRLELPRQGLLAEREEGEGPGLGPLRPLDEGGVDPIRRRTRHEPDHPHAPQPTNPPRGRSGLPGHPV